MTSLNTILLCTVPMYHTQIQLLNVSDVHNLVYNLLKMYCNLIQESKRVCNPFFMIYLNFFYYIPFMVEFHPCTSPFLPGEGSKPQNKLMAIMNYLHELHSEQFGSSPLNNKLFCKLNVIVNNCR